MENKFRIDPTPPKNDPYRCDKPVIIFDKRFPFIHRVRLCANTTTNNGEKCLDQGSGCKRYCQR